jgi:hypothetical protein
MRATIVLIGISLAACASGSPSADGESLSLRAAPARNVLTAAEIVAARVSDAYQAVTQLRPDFLRRRATSAAVTPVKSAAVSVYLDDLPFGNVESLRTIPLERVRVIRYLTPFDADLRWGGSHPAGAILVTTLKR